MPYGVSMPLPCASWKPLVLAFDTGVHGAKRVRRYLFAIVNNPSAKHHRGTGQASLICAQQEPTTDMQRRLKRV